MAGGSGDVLEFSTPLAVLPLPPPVLRPVGRANMGFGAPIPAMSVGSSHAGTSGASGSGTTSTLGVGQLKLDGPAKFAGPNNRPSAVKWLERLATWMTLMRYPIDEWILICSMQLNGHAASWFSAQRKGIEEGERNQWLNWAEFSH